MELVFVLFFALGFFFGYNWMREAFTPGNMPKDWLTVDFGGGLKLYWLVILYVVLFVAVLALV
jgi:hypothetical protein